MFYKKETKEIKFNGYLSDRLNSGEKVFITMKTPRFSRWFRYKIYIQIGEYKVYVLESLRRNFKQEERSSIDDFNTIIEEDVICVYSDMTIKNSNVYIYMYYQNGNKLGGSYQSDRLIEADNMIVNRKLNDEY